MGSSSLDVTATAMLDEVAAELDWDQERIIEHLLGFIEGEGLDEAFVRFSESTLAGAKKEEAGSPSVS